MNATHISTSEDESISPSEATAQTPTSVGSSAALISFFVIISRITGFMRTWAMAFALGSTMLASSYQVANNLPNMLYELVMGGMLVTAFLPVYMSVKAKLGDRGGNEYASNIMSIAFIVLGAVALVCTVFAPALIFTQSFMNDQSTMDDAVFFFRFFAIQIVFYGLSSIVSGLLNASRDYLWSSAAPIFNNIIVTATFVLYAFVAPHDSELAKLIIAVGNPLGVFVQMAIQLPALKRNGIKLRLRVDLRDPALKETLAIGVPAVLVMCAGLVVVSIQNAAAYGALDNGPSIIAYARLWFTLPYAFLTVPITTAMFTEISEMHANGNMRGFRHGIISGTNQIVFFMVPFALYLVVFAEPLVTLYHIGAFTEDNISQIALYLAALALSLPFYGINTYLQKVFSAMRIMGRYAVMMVACIAFQIGFIAVFATGIGGPLNIGMPAIALSETAYYLALDIVCFVYLRKRTGALGLKSTVVSFLRSFLLGLLGASAGALAITGLSATIAPLNGSIPNALICIVCGGLLALAITFGLAIKLKLSEASMVSSLIEKVARRFKRKTAELPAGGDEAVPDSTPENAGAYDAARYSGASFEQNDSVAMRRRAEASAEDLGPEAMLPLGKHAARARDAHDASPSERGRHAATHDSVQTPDAAPSRKRGRHASPAGVRGLHASAKTPSPSPTEAEFGRHASSPVETRENSSVVKGSRHAVGEASRHTRPLGNPKHARAAKNDTGRKNGPRHAK
ncbi:lipid II flippase MurJ [Slackia sp.]|uniref:lipid II flippase MurJ n=1 Tax=Slackia sp. TaxID=2049041 RepID=UPI00260BD263|nr:lipid II flippase MurJ [Slackia sp.]MEE0519497.1 lipid II flippase MurJ [Slackia sp.]